MPIPFPRTRTASQESLTALREALPRPTDAPVVVVPGPDPDRVLLLGGSPVAGLGVATHQESLVGTLAHALARRTGRGAVVEARGRVGAALPEVGALLVERAVHRYDVLVIAAGLVDAEGDERVRRWRRALEALVLRLRSDGARDATVALVRIPAASSTGIHGRASPRRIDARVARLNRALDRVAERTNRVLLVETAPVVPGAAMGSPAWYSSSAELLAERLADALG